MEQAKKAPPKPTLPSAQLQSLIDIGVPVKMAVFHRAVRSHMGEPETAFYNPEPNMKPSRVANMWYTPHGLVCEQKGKYKIIPLANVSDTNI